MNALTRSSEVVLQGTNHGRTEENRSSSAVWFWWVMAISVAAVVASAIQVISGQTDRGFFLIALCFLVCGAGAWVDVATRRIPNPLTYPALLIGLTVNALLPPVLIASGAVVAMIWSGATGLTDGLLGFGLCAVIGVVSFAFRGVGGGDVKLLAAVGAMLGLYAVIPVLFNTLMFAALIGIANWALKGTLMARVQVVAANMLSAAVTRRGLTEIYPFGRSEAPFGLALLLGLTLAQFLAVHEVILGLVL